MKSVILTTGDMSGGRPLHAPTRTDAMLSSAIKIALDSFCSARCPRPAPPTKHSRNGLFRIRTSFRTAVLLACLLSAMTDPYFMQQTHMSEALVVSRSSCIMCEIPNITKLVLVLQTGHILALSYGWQLASSLMNFCVVPGWICRGKCYFWRV